MGSEEQTNALQPPPEEPGIVAQQLIQDVDESLQLQGVTDENQIQDQEQQATQQGNQLEAQVIQEFFKPDNIADAWICYKASVVQNIGLPIQQQGLDQQNPQITNGAING